MLEVLLHINLYLSTRQPQNIEFLVTLEPDFFCQKWTRYFRRRTQFSDQRMDDMEYDTENIDVRSRMDDVAHAIQAMPAVS